MKKTLFIIASIAFVAALCATDLDDVRLFQGYTMDGAVSSTSYVDPAFIYSNYDHYSKWFLGGRGGFKLPADTEMQLQLGVGGYSPDHGNGDNGLYDPMVSIRHQFVQAPAKISAGAWMTFPIGTEDIGEQNFNFGFFGAARYPIVAGTDLTGALGIDSRESSWSVDDDRETALALNLGCVTQFTPEFEFVGEFDFRSEWNWALFSLGGDYCIPTGTHLRAQLGVGLDEGAPDAMLQFSLLFPTNFSRYFK